MVQVDTRPALQQALSRKGGSIVSTHPTIFVGVESDPYKQTVWTEVEQVVPQGKWSDSSKKQAQPTYNELLWCPSASKTTIQFHTTVITPVLHFRLPTLSIFQIALNDFNFKREQNCTGETVQRAKVLTA